jgi:hypothetical protein
MPGQVACLGLMEYAEAPMNKMNPKQWIALVIWYLLYLSAMQFFRIQFGIHKSPSHSC